MATAATAKPSPQRKRTSPQSARPAGGPRKRFGSVTPTFWTRPLRKLTRKTSLGYDAIDFADWIHARIVQIAAERDEPELLDLAPALLEWQRWFLIHALELLPGPRLVFRFRIVLLLVARQNGKTAVLVYLILWRLFQDGGRLIIGTAQTLEIAEEAWSTVVAIAEAIPELAEDIKQVKTAAGKQSVQLDSRERYKIAAANRRGGRGLSGGELVLLDELREHTNWASWSAVSKTTMARERAQVYGVSNAGDLTSVVLTFLRGIALGLMGIIEKQELEDELDEEMNDVDAAAIGLFEWSAVGKDGKNLPIKDRDGWAMANPSMGYTELAESSIAAAALTDPEWVFRMEVLCQFVDTSTGGPWESGSWEATRVPKVVRDVNMPAGYCIDVSEDRAWTSILISFYDTEGRYRVELAERLPGTDWVVPWLMSEDRKVKPRLLTLQTNGAPVSSLIDSIEKAGLELVEWAGGDLGRASGIAYDALRDGLVTHGTQAPLDIAATTAVPKTMAGGAWVIDRKASTQDAAPVIGFIGALWALIVHGDDFKESIYESTGIRSV